MTNRRWNYLRMGVAITPGSAGFSLPKIVAFRLKPALPGVP